MKDEMRKEITRGMYFSDRCQFCHDFGEKVEPYLCPDCKERIRKLGYVKLAENQELPPNHYWAEIAFGGRGMIYGQAQKGMLKAGFRKVERKASGENRKEV